MPRTGRTGGEPNCLRDRQPEREKRRKGGSCIDPHGFDAGKLIKGKKRHVLVDTMGLVLQVLVTAANVQDRDGGVLLLSCSDSSRSCASCSLTAPMQAPSSTTVPPQRCAVWWSRLSNALMAPRALSSNPSVGSLSAPLPGSIAAGGSPRTGKTATTMHSPSSASPPSASCSDGSVILHEVFGRTLRMTTFSPLYSDAFSIVRALSMLPCMALAPIS